MSSIRAAIVPVVLIGLTLRLGFASGFVDLDDRYYIEAAHRISSGNWSVVADHRATRLGVVVPAALVFASFGVGFWQVVMVPLLCSMAGVLVAFEGGRRLFDVRTGLVAALLLCVFPLDVIYSGRLSPTAPIGLWSGTGALLLIGADEHRRWILAGLAGLAFGLAFMCGETPLFVFVVYPAYVLTARPPARRHLAVVAGFLAALVVEAGLTAWMSGDPLTRVWVLLGADTVRAVNVDVAHAGWTVEWLIHPLLRVCTEQELGLFLIVGLPLASVRIFRSTVPAERALAVWVLVLFLWVSYGSVSPVDYAPLARLPRYLAIVQIPLVILLALWLGRIPARRAMGWGVLIAFSSVACLVMDGSRFRSIPCEAMCEFVASKRPARVVVDSEIRMPFLFFNGFSPAMEVSVLSNVSRVPTLVDLETGRRRDGLKVLEAGTLVVARRPAVRAWLAEQDDLRLVGRFQPADTLYRRALRNPIVRRVLGFARSEYRMKALGSQVAGADTIEAFEVTR